MMIGRRQPACAGACTRQAALIVAIAQVPPAVQVLQHRPNQPLPATATLRLTQAQCLAASMNHLEGLRLLQVGWLTYKSLSGESGIHV